MPSRNEEYIGIDMGEAWAGLARGSSMAKLAEPLKTVPADKAVEELAVLVTQSQPAGIVVGLPRNLEGNDTQQTRKIRQWTNKAKKSIDAIFYLQDEALTSHAAAVQARSSQFDEHSLAAAIILQDFLDTPEDERVRC